MKEGAVLEEKYNDTGAATHFGQSDHEFEKDMKLYMLENSEWGSAYERKQKEGYYICKYRTVVPEGMNKYAGTAQDFYEKIYRQKNTPKNDQ